MDPTGKTCVLIATTMNTAENCLPIIIRIMNRGAFFSFFEKGWGFSSLHSWFGDFQSCWAEIDHVIDKRFWFGGAKLGNVSVIIEHSNLLQLHRYRR